MKVARTVPRGRGRSNASSLPDPSQQCDGPTRLFAAYTSAKGRALVDRELYLPRSWTDDPDRCRTARIPEHRSFATKPELARAMVLRALGSALPIAWVTADAAYGQERGFRRMLEEAGVGYVLAVPKSQQVKSAAGSWRIDVF